MFYCFKFIYQTNYTVLYLRKFPKILIRVGSVNRKTLRVDQSKTTSNETKIYLLYCFGDAF